MPVGECHVTIWYKCAGNVSTHLWPTPDGHRFLPQLVPLAAAERRVSFLAMMKLSLYCFGETRRCGLAFKSCLEGHIAMERMVLVCYL